MTPALLVELVERDLEAPLLALAVAGGTAGEAQGGADRHVLEDASRRPAPWGRRRRGAHGRAADVGRPGRRGGDPTGAARDSDAAAMADVLTTRMETLPLLDQLVPTLPAAATTSISRR